jgi:hypothetical protein
MGPLAPRSLKKSCPTRKGGGAGGGGGGDAGAPEYKSLRQTDFYITDLKSLDSFIWLGEVHLKE